MERLKGEFKIVPIDQVQPNTWNPKDNPEMNPVEYGNVLKSISVYGLRQAIVVREIGPDKYEIIDGVHRWLACKELGYKNVIINNQGQVSDQEAKKLTINFQDVRVPFNQLELAGLIKELSQLEQNLQDSLPYTQDEIQEYISLLDFDWSQYQTNLGGELEPCQHEWERCFKCKKCGQILKREELMEKEGKKE